MESEYKNIKKKKFNKKLVIPLVVVFAMGMVFAVGYIVNSLTLTVGVAEPFEVQYAVLGDAENYVSQTCENAQWFTSDSTNIPTGNMYAGESRYVCVKINNKAEAVIPYTISNTVTGSQECIDAFSKPVLNGNVEAQTTLTTGSEVSIPTGATPVEGCIVRIDVARG